MADQKITVDLEANAEPLIQASDNISQNAEVVTQSLDDIGTAGEQTSASIENIAEKADATNSVLADLGVASSDASLKLDDIQDSSKKAADGIGSMKEKVSGASDELDDIRDSSKKAADGIEDIKDSSKKAADGIDDIQDSSKKAADGIEDIGDASGKTAQDVTKAEQKVVAALEQIDKHVKRTKFEKLGDVSIRLNAIASTAKNIAEPFKKVIGQLQEIGENARALGTSAEYFQKLQRVSEQTGEKFEDVQSVFTKINETASKALSGNADAAKKLANIGIAVDDLRGKNPQQIFETVAGALAAAGDEAISSDAALAVCGDRLVAIGDNLADLANADAKISDGEIVPDEAVQASQELKENFSQLGQELLALIAQSGFVDWLSEAARVVGGIKDDIKEIQAAKKLVEEGKVRDLGKEYNAELDNAGKKKWKIGINVATLGLGYLPKLWGGRSLGATVMGYKEEGVQLATDAVTPEELAKARRDLEAKRGRQASMQSQATKTREAIKDSNAASEKDTSSEREMERARKEAEAFRRQAARMELQRQREVTRAAMQQQREMERANRQTKTKTKTKEYSESAPLSTAGGISDRKEARRQRSHELRLARELAKQRIKIKVKPVKGSVIRAAVENATSAPLKELASAVDRLSKQTYVVK